MARTKTATIEATQIEATPTVYAVVRDRTIAAKEAAQAKFAELSPEAQHMARVAATRTGQAIGYGALGGIALAVTAKTYSVIRGLLG
jgi:hypothetical protein